uniref:Uncharacterized protein n=1 Tax=Octopus bimaculoides TaxID=37653 RepID=A0A0L8GH34_OCTBM
MLNTLYTTIFSLIALTASGGGISFVSPSTFCTYFRYVYRLSFDIFISMESPLTACAKLGFPLETLLHTLSSSMGRTLSATIRVAIFVKRQKRK